MGLFHSIDFQFNTFSRRRGGVISQTNTAQLAEGAQTAGGHGVRGRQEKRLIIQRHRKSDGLAWHPKSSNSPACCGRRFFPRNTVRFYTSLPWLRGRPKADANSSASVAALQSARLSHQQSLFRLPIKALANERLLRLRSNGCAKYILPTSVSLLASSGCLGKAAVPSLGREKTDTV